MNARDEDGTIEAVLERLVRFRLPRALGLKAAVDRGQVLGEFDLEFLQIVFADLRNLHPLVDHHAELEPLVTKLIGLYSEITQKALENEARNSL